MQKRYIQEVIKPAASGMTAPYLCILDNGDAYYVKGRQALPTGLIAEVVVGKLGQAFGLPIPPFCLAMAPDGLLEADEGASTSLGNGWCFASKVASNLAEMPPSQLEKIGREFQQRLFLFDYWVQNEDRTGVDGQGNPNLFLDVGTSQPVVIDHNLAFDPSYNFTSNSKLHVCAKGWFTPSVDLIFPQRALDDMKRSLDALTSLESEIPEEWMEGAPGHLYGAYARLWSLEQDDFWEPLK